MSGFGKVLCSLSDKNWMVISDVGICAVPVINASTDLMSTWT